MAQHQNIQNEYLLVKYDKYDKVKYDIYDKVKYDKQMVSGQMNTRGQTNLIQCISVVDMIIPPNNIVLKHHRK